MKDKTVTLIHYGELSLKGRNRSLFEIRLQENIERTAGGRVLRQRGRFVMEGGNPEALSRVFGISWYASAFVVDKDYEAIRKAVLKRAGEVIEGKADFGVNANRSDKSFPLPSMELASRIGGEVAARFGLPVNLGNPALRINIEIADRVYIYFDRVEGLRGFPTGVSGKVLSLLSGGIDSPVSSFLMMKRGCRVDFIHFHVFSSNDKVFGSKMENLARMLDSYQGRSRLHLVPYYPFEMALLGAGDVKGHELILFRRFMARVACRVAAAEMCQALVTGDSLGQVASQTMENIALFRDAARLPVFQPLIAFDKQEIVDYAKKIGTYEISIADYKDCCSIVSSGPRTRAHRGRVEELEKAMDVESVLERTLELITVYEL